VDPSSLANGAQLSRAKHASEGSQLHPLTTESVQGLVRLTNDVQNPHTFGLDAREVFFLEDGVVLVEGQEDVLGYEAAARQLDTPLPGSFYGWGVGGADKMSLISRMLRDLGFTRVVGILDGNRRDAAERLKGEFPHYAYLVSEFDDVRDKPSIPERGAVRGMLTTSLDLPAENRDAARSLLTQVQRSLQST